MEPELEHALGRARQRLEGLALYRKPLPARVWVVVWPWFFRLPPYRRYVAYALVRLIVLSAPPEELIRQRGPERFEDLLVHELCHIWQGRNHPLRVLVALLRYRYEENPFEREAREAAARGR